MYKYMYVRAIRYAWYDNNRSFRKLIVRVEEKNKSAMKKKKIIIVIKRDFWARSLMSCVHSNYEISTARVENEGREKYVLCPPFPLGLYPLTAGEILVSMKCSSVTITRRTRWIIWKCPRCQNNKIQLVPIHLIMNVCNTSCRNRINQPTCRVA